MMLLSEAERDRLLVFLTAELARARRRRGLRLNVVEATALVADAVCEAARDGDVSIHGGASTINQYLAAGLIDELRLHIVPLTLGGGTRLFDGVPPLNLEQVDSRAASSVTHVTYRVLS